MNKRRRYKAKRKRAEKKKWQIIDPTLTAIFLKYSQAANDIGYIADKVMAPGISFVGVRLKHSPFLID